MSQPLLILNDIKKSFYRNGAQIKALEDINLSVHAGETLALVGPSGSGKSTLARIIMCLEAPDQGTISFKGNNLLALRSSRLRSLRADFQMVFQDPLAAFNPRATVERVLRDPLRIHNVVARTKQDEAIGSLLNRVGLPNNLRTRAIHEISGGQRQRVAIARALATKPSLIVLDEAVSALDVSMRGQIINLLVDLQRSEGIAFLFVSHDIGIVRAMAHRVAIMESGRIVELGSSDDVLRNPCSATGAALIAAVPRLTCFVSADQQL
jgi:peptide/nickel transport system ATP-binding protein